MAIYYVSPTGSDSNAGTLNAPWHSLNYAFNQLSAGDQLYMRGGTYTTLYSSLIGIRISGINGTYNAPIEVTNYQNEVPVLDGSALSGGSEMFGIQMVNCDYWYIKGLKIQNVRGVNFSRGFEFQDGCSNCTLERVDITLCGGGFTFGGSIPFYNILYKNCDAWDNWDVVDSGGYCNGFNGNLPAGSTVTCYGCRSWHNSDDGYDNMAGGGYITYINCWAFWNGHTSIGGSTSGDGDGFKLGYTTKGDEAGNQRTLYNCLAFENDLMGFDESMDAATSQDMALYNCVSYGNANYGFRFSAANIGGAGTGVTTLRNNIAYNDGGTEYEGRARNVEDHNTWDGGVTVSDADFVSVSSVGADGARQTDGSLPVLNFLHLVAGSDLKNAGSATGVYNTDGAGYAWGTPPSMGAYEVGSTPPPDTVLVTSITLSAPSAVITTQNGTLQITATVLPVNATNQTIQWIVIAGTGTGSVSNTGLLTALTDGTVTVRANATDGSGIFGTYSVTISNQSTILPPTSGLRDRDGNEYTSIVIGTQEWIVENLRTTHYSDGNPILNINDCKNSYGVLYNWYAVNTGKLAPAGWHIPSWTEFETLLFQIDADGTPALNTAANDMKETGVSHWLSPNANATNLSGFTAIPTGIRRGTDGAFTVLTGSDRRAYYWNAEENPLDTTKAFISGMLGTSSVFITKSGIYNGLGMLKSYGYGVRPIKDDSTDPGTVTDIDGNVYNTIKIGSQVWFAENLKVESYNDGDPIPNITLDASWIADTSGAMCFYNNESVNDWNLNVSGAYTWYNNDISNKTLGSLYNWFAVNNASGLAYLERDGVEETDWHIPTSAEIATLLAYLSSAQGIKLKESGTSHWTTNNGTNVSGFTAIGVGKRGADCTFSDSLTLNYIWDSDGNILLINDDNTVTTPAGVDNDGYNVRLMRDYSSVPPEPPDPPVPPTFPNVIPYNYGNAPTFRFFISSVSSVSYEVFPLKFLSSSLITELQKDKILYRQKFSGSLIFGSNSKVLDSLGVEHNRRDDWDLFWMIELSDPDGKYYLTIYKDFGGVTETYFEGYFSTSDGEFDIDNCTFEVTPIAIDDYNEIFENADTKQNILSVPAMGTVHAIHGGMDVNYTRTRWLAKLGSDNVLEYIAQRTFGLNVIVLSDFFTVDPNYVTLTDNLLLNLTIAQKSDIIRYNSSDPATYAPLTWNELMEILWNMFQVTWKYDIFTDTVRVEHISYFTRGSGIDLRTQLLCNATNKYKYLKEKMPKFEKFSFMEADETNFVGAFIYYDSGAVNQDSESNRVDTTIQVTTDLEYIYYNPDAISDEGFVILCNYLDGADYKVRLDSGKLATTVKLNMNLSVANLQDAFFRHNRVLIEGYLNGVLTDFWTAQKTKIQTCSAILCDPIDPLDEITTELGETYLGGAKAVVKDLTVDPMGLAKFTLLYGPPDNTNTGIPNIFSVEVTLVVRSPYDPAFDEIDLLYVFNQPAVGNITTRFRVATFNDTGVFQGYSGWTNAILLDTTLSLSVLNHQISVLSAGWSISIELEYTESDIAVMTGVPDATWSYMTPFIYTKL